MLGGDAGLALSLSAGGTSGHLGRRLEVLLVAVIVADDPIRVAGASDGDVTSTDSVRPSFSQNPDEAAHAIGRMAALIDRYRA